MSKRLRPSAQPSGKGLSIRPKAAPGRASSLSLIPPAPRVSQSSAPAPIHEAQEAAAHTASEALAVAVEASTALAERLPRAVSEEDDEPESRQELTAPSAVMTPAAALDWDDGKKAVEVVAPVVAVVPEVIPAAAGFTAEARATKDETPEAVADARAEVPSSAAEPPTTRAESPTAIARVEAAPAEAKVEAAPAEAKVEAAPAEAKVQAAPEGKAEAAAVEAEAARPAVVEHAVVVEAAALEATSPSMASPLAATSKVAPAAPNKGPAGAAEEPEARATTGKAVAKSDNEPRSGKATKGGKGPAAKGEPAKSEAAKNEAAKGEAAKGEAVKAAAKPAGKSEDEGEDEGRPSRKSPGVVRVGEDEIDLSSVSAEFFRRDHDSLPPVTEPHAELEEPVVAQLSPATLARRARLRRVVAGVVAFAGVLSIAVVGKTLAASKRSSSTLNNKPPVVNEVKPAPKVDESAAVVVTAAPIPVAPASAVPSAAASADPSAMASATPSATPSAAPSAEPAAAPGGDPVALRKETENLLNRGKMKEAIAKAREAIAADPTDAHAYLYLGSALQDTGKWKDGIEAYSECVRNATKGPVNECRQMGGRK